jgi:hypothetical protein
LIRRFRGIDAPLDSHYAVRRRAHHSWGSPIRHITCGPEPNEKPYGIGTVRFLAIARTGAAESLERAKRVLETCLKLPISALEDYETLRRALPEFFVEGFAPETNREEDEAFLAIWRAASEEERREIDSKQGWSLLGWAYWLKPENREWWWWDASAVSDLYCAVAVAVDGWPFAWEALKILFVHCGFEDVKPEKDE